MNVIIKQGSRTTVKEAMKLLVAHQLPVQDIQELNNAHVHFFVASLNDEIIGVIGLERYGGTGLLRSLAVKDGYKSLKTGEKLMKHLLAYCIQEKVNEVYLLTTTAEKYFYKFGFQLLDRNTAPEAIKETREFKGICPASAVFMGIQLNN